MRVKILAITDFSTGKNIDFDKEIDAKLYVLPEKGNVDSFVEKRIIRMAKEEDNANI